MDDIKKYFASARRQYIDTPLKEFGFKPYKSSFLARMTTDNVFQLIDFHKYRFGGQFTIEIAIRPMYCPRDEYLTLLPGNRLYTIATNGKSDKWWKNTTQVETDESFKDVCELIKKDAIPFFNSTKSSNEIIKAYEKNLFGISKFGKRICWGTIGWENFDFGHIYLKAGDATNSIKQINRAYKEFINDSRDWAQVAAKKCLEIKEIIKSGQAEIDKYLEQTIETSRKNLKLEQW